MRISDWGLRIERQKATARAGIAAGGFPQIRPGETGTHLRALTARGFFACGGVDGVECFCVGKRGKRK